MKTLLLNADYTPLDIIGWQRAIIMSLGYEKPVYILEYHNKSIRDSVGRVYAIPSVVVLKNYIQIDTNKAAYNKINVYCRDQFCCQYCGKQFSRKDLTVDHVIPKSKWKSLGHKGTSSCFENVVTACLSCNTRKKDRTPQDANMPLISQPKKITRRQAFLNKVAMQEMHEKWLPYLESFINVKKKES